MGLRRLRNIGITRKNTRNASKIKQLVIQRVDGYRKLQQYPTPIESVRIFHSIWVGIPPLESNNSEVNLMLMRSK